MNVAELKKLLRVPVIAAPMLLVSGPPLLTAACKAGVVGGMPADMARTAAALQDMLKGIIRDLEEAAQRTGVRPAPWALNLTVMDSSDARFVENMALIAKYRPPIVITSFGAPGPVATRVHDYGGLVFHDVANMRHVVKCIEAGVDGLIVLTAGAGGHAGTANPFAFVPQIRKIWDGAVLLAGSISDGRSVFAAEVLGADFAYMGTRFAATQESSASDEYKSLLLSQQTSDIITTDLISGVLATFMRGSIKRVGLDPDNLPPHKAKRTPGLPEGIKPWRDIWSAGHGVGMIDDLPTTAELVERIAGEYAEARSGFSKP